MVYGFEIMNSAVQYAMQNAARNTVKNAWFFMGDMKYIFRKNLEVKDLITPDVIIVDPPRVGLHSNTIEDIEEKAPKRIIYVSCNPSTQARDIKIFIENKYKISDIQPIDMFPHTPHIECIITLNK